MFTLSTVISTWCNLCEIYAYISFLHKTLGCHEAGFTVAVGIVGCHNDNLRCHQCRHSWHCGSSRFLVFMYLFKCFYVSNQMVCEISLHSVPSLSPHFAIYFSKQPRKDTPWLTCKGEVWEVFNWLIVWSELWLCSACLCSILRWPTVIWRKPTVFTSAKRYFRIFVMWCFIFTVLSTWCNLCEIHSRICLLSRP